MQPLEEPSPEPIACDVLIIGAGIAGSLLAFVLGRQGRKVVVVDPRRTPPPVFRNEKLGGAQIALLKKLGALSCFEAALWPAEGTPGAYPEGQRPALTDCGAPHQAWVMSVRQGWSPDVRFVEATVHHLDLSDDIQRATTTDGQRIEARLAVLATGRIPQLRQSLGVNCRTLSAGHSVCLGFSAVFDTSPPAQVVDAPRGSGVGYVSLFPMPGETRVNVFSYRALDDPWTRRMSADPMGCLSELDPRLAALFAGGRVVRRCEARGTDLYEVSGHRQAGLVLIGDAFHAPCPASGTGMLRILNDIDHPHARPPAGLDGESRHGLRQDRRLLRRCGQAATGRRLDQELDEGARGGGGDQRLLARSPLHRQSQTPGGDRDPRERRLICA